MRAPELGFEVLGGHQRWALEERGRGRPKEGAPSEEDLEDQTVPRDRGCEEEIPKGGGGHSGAGILGPGQLWEGGELGMGNSAGQSSQTQPHRGFAQQSRGGVPAHSAARPWPQIPAPRGPLPAPAQRPPLRSSAASQPGTSRAELPGARAPSPPPRAGPEPLRPRGGRGRGGASKLQVPPGLHCVSDPKGLENQLFFFFFFSFPGLHSCQVCLGFWQQGARGQLTQKK